MATSQTQHETGQDTRVAIKHTCDAPRERVFRAWTDAGELAQWFHPSLDHSTVVRERVFRVGGTYRVEMHHKTGTIHRLYGTYRRPKSWSSVGAGSPRVPKRSSPSNSAIRASLVGPPKISLAASLNCMAPPFPATSSSPNPWELWSKKNSSPHPDVTS